MHGEKCGCKRTLIGRAWIDATRETENELIKMLQERKGTRAMVVGK